MDEVEPLAYTNDTLPIQMRDGCTILVVKFHAFPAFDGYEMEQEYLSDYVNQPDRYVRRAFIVKALAHVECFGRRLDTEEAINSSLESWRNVEAVFNGVLAYNGIALESRPEKASYWNEAGGSVLAAAFAASVAGLAAKGLKNG